MEWSKTVGIVAGSDAISRLCFGVVRILMRIWVLRVEAFSRVFMCFFALFGVAQHHNKSVKSLMQTDAMIVTDIQTVSVVVGRIRTRGKWTIVDRSGGLIKPEFVPSVDVVDEQVEEE